MRFLFDYRINIMENNINDQKINQEIIEEYWEKNQNDANKLTGNALDMVSSALQKMEEMTSNIRDIYLDLMVSPYESNPEAHISPMAQRFIFADHLFDQVKELQGYDVCYEDDVLEVTIPMSLPKRNKTATNEFKENLHIALERFNRADEEQHMRIVQQLSDAWVVVIQHVYSRANLMRDNDNVNIKHVIDEISRQYNLSDRGDHCSIMQCTCKEMEEKAVTHIYVMSPSKFIDWYKKIMMNEQ